MNGFSIAVTSLAAAFALVGTIFFVTQAANVADREGTKRIEACVESGGTWLSQYSMCINNGKE